MKEVANEVDFIENMLSVMSIVFAVILIFVSFTMTKIRLGAPMAFAAVILLIMGTGGIIYSVNH